MPTQLPPDPVQMINALKNAIKGVIDSITISDDFRPKVWARERFTDSDEEDKEIAATPDPVSDDLWITNIVQVGIPTVEERPYTGDTMTQFELVFPIIYEFEVRDLWDNGDNLLEFDNSTAVVEAVYWRARRKFKDFRDLGFENCVHEYLQRPITVNVTDEDTGGKLHVHDWSLTVKITSVVI